MKPSSNKRRFNHPLLPYCLIFLLFFALYLKTAAPDITLIDSSEFITAVALLGNPHSPGYPVYTMTAGSFNFPPLGDLPFRINLFSAFAGALSAALLFGLARFIFGGIFGPAAAAMLWGFGNTFWGQCTSAEVYALAVSLILIFLWNLLIGAEKESLKRLLFSAFLAGLAVGVHQMIVFTFPAVLYLLVAHYRKKIWDIKIVTAGALFVLLGYSSQLYLPLRAHAGAEYSWERPDDFDSWHGLITTKTFHKQRFVRSFDAFLHSLDNFGTVIRENLPSGHWLWAVVGFVLMVITKNKWTIFCFLLWALSSLIGIVLFNIPEEWYFFTEVFFLPGLIIWSIWGGMFWRVLEKKTRTGALVLLSVVAGCLTVQSYAWNDLSRNYLLRDWTFNILSTPRSRAVVVVEQDENFPLEYMLRVEKYRNDVAAIHHQSLLTPDEHWVRADIARLYPWLKMPNSWSILPRRRDRINPEDALLVQALKKLRLLNQNPVFLTALSAELVQNFFIVNEGLLYAIKNKEIFDRREWLKKDKSIREKYRLRRVTFQCPEYERPELEIIQKYRNSETYRQKMIERLEKPDIAKNDHP